MHLTGFDIGFLTALVLNALIRKPLSRRTSLAAAACYLVFALILNALRGL